MRRVSIKSGAIIVIYSLLLSIILGIGIFTIKDEFSRVAKDKVPANTMAMIVNANGEKNENLVYEILNKDEFFNLTGEEKLAFNNSGIKEENLISVEKIGKIYLKSGFQDILWLLIIFFIIFIIASFLLWVILNRIHNREIENIVKNLNMLDEDFNPYSISKSFGIAYENIKEKFKQNLEDYKKLNSYLSHEQKNEIAILRTNLEIDGKNEYLKLLDNITDSMDDILTLSDLEADKNMIVVDVSLICAEVCDRYNKIYRKIEFDFEDNTLILGKERWIYRAISNLIDNAIKYGNGKSIEVKVRNRFNSVIVEVKDYGIGMDKDFIEKIFNNKYRIHDLKKDGYGIGLSLVSHVCDLCNGMILVDSEKDKGSCFYMSFKEYKY